MRSDLPRYEDIFPPSYDTLPSIRRAPVARSERQSIRLSLNIHHPTLRSSAEESIRNHGAHSVERCLRHISPESSPFSSPILSPLASLALGPFASPTSGPLTPMFQSHTRDTLRRQSSANYFHSLFILNNNEMAHHTRVTDSAVGHVDGMKWLEQKTSQDEDEREQIRDLERQCRKSRCRESIHFITFLWSDVEHAKCVATNMDKRHSCYAEIPMNFWTSFGFSVCRATFCTTASIFLSGGHGSASKDMHKYDLYHNKWVECRPMITSRRNHAMVSNDHKIYVIGGVDVNKTPVQSIDAYNLKTNRWKCTGHLTSPVSHPTAVRSMDNIYIFGGKDEHDRNTDFIQKFVTTNNTCKLFEKRLCARISDAKGVHKGKHIYIAGNHGLFVVFNTMSEDSTRLTNHGMNLIHKIISSSPDSIDVIGQRTVDALIIRRFDLNRRVWATVNEFICRGHIEGIVCLSHCPL